MRTLVKMKIRAILSRITRGFNAENLSKADKIITKSINALDSGLKEFGKSCDTITGELSNEVEQSNKNSRLREQRDKENVEKLWGNKKDHGRKQRDKENLDKIWGKRYD